MNGSELVLEIAEVSIANLTLDGSLIVKAENPIGHQKVTGNLRSEENGSTADSRSELQFSKDIGRIELDNATIENAGIDWSHHENVYWKHKVFRKASCTINLHGRSEFAAKDITISGHHVFDVPDGHRLELLPDPSRKTGFIERVTKLPYPSTWEWNYAFKRQHVVLSYVKK